MQITIQTEGNTLQHYETPTTLNLYAGGVVRGFWGCVDLSAALRVWNPTRTSETWELGTSCFVKESLGDALEATYQ